MTLQDQPTQAAKQPVDIRQPDVRHATGVQAGDIDLIKSLSRDILPEIKPGQRLEFLARAYGFKSAIAMRNAIMSATEEDLYLKPSQAPFDDFRSSVIVQLAKTDALTQEVSDRLTQCAPLVNAGLEMSRGKWNTFAEPHPEGTPYSKQSVADLFSHVKASEVGHGTNSSGYWGPYFIDMVLPDLRWLDFGSWRFTQGGGYVPRRLLSPNEDYVEVVSVSKGSPSRAEIEVMGAPWRDGDIRQRVFAAAAGYLEEPVYTERSTSFTLLSRSKDGAIKAFITVSFEVDHASTDDDETIREAIYHDEFEPLSESDIEYFRASNWLVAMSFSGYGILGDGDELGELDIFDGAIFSFYSTFFDHVGEAANRCGHGVRIEVYPEEGDNFGFLTFDSMLDGIRECIQNYRTGEYYVCEDEDDGFELVMIEP